MLKIETKPLKLEKEGNWLQRKLWTAHTKKTLLFMLLGAIAGTVYFYLTDGKHMVNYEVVDVLKSALLGAFLGFFLTNSPCARGRC